MPSIKLTQIAVERLKPPASGEVEYWDNQCPGFGLRIRAPKANGQSRKTWQAMYRVNGKLVRETIGTLATLPSVADARKLARDSLQKAHQGINPVDAKHHKEPEAETFAAVFERYFRQHVGKRSVEYQKELKRSFTADVLPALGAVPIDKLTRRQIRDVIDTVAERAEPYAAHVRKYLGTFLNWAVKQDILAANPGVGPDPDTRKREDRERDRWLGDDEIRLFWFACNRTGYAFRPLYQLLLLLGCRRDELAEATWSEFDLERQLWTLPGRRSKNGNELLTHLAPAALAILRALPRLRPGDPGELLFTSSTGVSPIANFTAALDRIRAEMAAMAGRPIPHFVLHDLRRSAASGMAELGVAEQIVDRILNHSGRKLSGTARIYNRSEYLPAREAALGLWADHVMALVGPKSVNLEIA